MNKEEIKNLCDENDYINEERTPRDYYYYTNGYQDCLNAEVMPLKQQLTKSNNKIEKIKEYITSYESISLIQGLDDIDKNKNLDTITITEMTNRYLKVHDNILSIIDGSDE